MRLDPMERQLLANTLHNYVERAWSNRPDYREFLDHLVIQYKKAGLDGLDPADRTAFLELIEEAL